MSTVRVKPLFELPESIHKIGFVSVLSEAVGTPEHTALTYVVTPKLRFAFERALGLVSTALRTGRSQAAFLMGSFGSGKSHFMAMLSLLASGHEAAWRVPELHPLRDKAEWAGKKKILELHFHMIGHESIEEAIFRKYVEHVRAHHPTATVPGLFADEKLFDDARRSLEELGEDAFFEPMNPKQSGDGAWGSFAEKVWDRARFEEAATSMDPEVRESLFSALVKTRYRAFASESRQFIDLDSGLGIISRHAKSLGYDAVVLFLDEIILWLASRVSHVTWFHNEVQKMVKLVESQDSQRDIPLISFLAQQRDLRDMVGDDYVGMEDRLVRDSLRWSKERYDQIELGDENLPAIVEKRVLRPKDEAARTKLDEAFAGLKKGAGDPAWQTMLGKLDASDFRRLYPFSPALVEALIALSNSLQRERTAIRLLTEILVEHIEDLSLGQVVGVGDLYDVLAGGEDSADGVMKARFESAKQLYNHRFLPVLQEQHGTNTAERCQRLRPGHPARLGCGNCPEKACRLDNRLIKTLIVAALVPEVPSLKDATASKLVQLNHGSLRLPIPGTEASLVAQKLRNWASDSRITQLHVGTQPDPVVRLQLEGVELGPILEQGRQVDNTGARQRVLRDLLFEAMGIEPIEDWGVDHKYKDWRGTDRLGHIRFGNVRKMGPEALRCPEGHEWRLVVDYPFDEAGFGPHDDEAVVERFREESGGSWTLVWLPSFFSHAINQMLGELVILEHILSTPSTTKGYVSHLSVENQSRAQNDLINLRTQKKARVSQALEQAYGLGTPREGDLDSAQTVEKHLVVLKPGAMVQPPLVANLATALDSYIPALLEARYPRHPRFTTKLTTRKVDELMELFAEIVDSEEKRIPADKQRIELARGTLGELGLVRVTETAVHLLEDRTLQELEKKRAQRSNDAPEVGEVRRWIDEGGKMGLLPEALDLVVRAYARWSARTLVSAGLPFDPRGGKQIPDHVVLEKPDLPTHDEWVRALAAAGTLFGLSLPGVRALHADNLKRFESELSAKVKAKLTACTRLPSAIRKRVAQLALVSEDGRDIDRLRTAVSAEAICAALSGRGGKAQIEALARYAPETSARAVGASIGSAERAASLLEDNLVFGTFESLRARSGEIPGAEELLAQVASVLRQDELNRSADELRRLAEEAQRLMRPEPPRPPPPPPGTKVLLDKTLTGRGSADVVAQLEAVLAEAKRAIESGDDAVLDGHIRITGRAKKR